MQQPSMEANRCTKKGAQREPRREIESDTDKQRATEHKERRREAERK